jgi:hypothetical protein
MSRKKTNNEINININVSDDLLNKFMGAIIKMNSMSSMGGLQMMLGGMMGGSDSEESDDKKEKATIGFKAPEKGE